MYLGDIWDWAFYWSVFRNFMASIAPFVMIPIAVITVGLLIGVLIWAVSKARR